MKGAKNVLILSSMWDNSSLYSIIQGMKNYYGDRDVNIHIFNAYDINDWEGTLRKEKEIYSLCDPEKYDGIVIASNSVGHLAIIQEKIDKYVECGKPVVNMGVKLDNTIFVGVDNYRAIYRMTEHMIKVHGASTFNFIGGPVDNGESILRYKGFCDCLKDNGLVPDPERVIHLAFLYEDGITAYEHFKQKGLHCADAVVSVNDSMVLGYCERAAKDNLYPPDDFRICGMDDFADAAGIVPSVTTINMNWENMGYLGAELLDRTLNGEAVERNAYSDEILRFRQSCGCTPLEHDYRQKSLTELKNTKHVEEIMIGNRYILNHLCNSRNLEQMQKRMPKMLELLRLQHMAICVNSTVLEDEMMESKDGYDDELLVCTENGIEKIKRRDRLTPESWDEDDSMKVLFFSPLYFGNITFGYSIAPYVESLVEFTKQRVLFENISISIETIRQRCELNAINKRLKDMYVHDSLTGLYNRFGYKELADSFYEEHEGRIYIIFMDLNRLKEINDVYGHAMGDKAIRGVADAIRNAFTDDDICVRMGGDEFLVMGAYKDEKDIEEKEERVDKFLERISKEENYPITISVSMGHAVNKDNKNSLSGLVKEADHKMYKVKGKSRRLI